MAFFEYGEGNALALMSRVTPGSLKFHGANETVTGAG